MAARDKLALFQSRVDPEKRRPALATAEELREPARSIYTPQSFVQLASIDRRESY